MSALSLDSPADSPAARSFESPDQFAALVSPHVPVLIRYAASFLPSEDMACDAVQETLLRLWNRGRLGEEPLPVLKYLVRRSCLHILRCQVRRTNHESLACWRETCCADDPWRHLESAELRAQLTHALAMLASEFRDVFERYELRGDSYERISVDLGIPLGTVRSRLSRARRRLRDALHGELG